MPIADTRPPVRRRPVFVSPTPFDENRVRAAAVYCSDGRFGEQMDEFLHAGLSLPRYDRVAVPGGAACLAGHVMASFEKAAIERQLEFLVREHQLRRIVLIAHDGCAFYKSLWLTTRTVEEQQAADLTAAADVIRLWNGHIEVEGYFARKVQGRVAFERWLGTPATAPAPATPRPQVTQVRRAPAQIETAT
ncbi:MAG: carbonic anhydrase [Phycisphaerae bacterium]|nr:carbonic anhydrase [Tepidisphaeraceae bacterium]